MPAYMGEGEWGLGTFLGEGVLIVPVLIPGTLKSHSTFSPSTKSAPTHPELVGLLDDFGEVEDVALGVRILEQDPRDVLLAEVDVEDVADLDVDAEGQRPGLHAADGLRVQLVAQDEPLPLVHPGKGYREMMINPGEMRQFLKQKPVAQP